MTTMELNDNVDRGYQLSCDPSDKLVSGMRILPSWWATRRGRSKPHGSCKSLVSVWKARHSLPPSPASTLGLIFGGKYLCILLIQNEPLSTWWDMWKDMRKLWSKISGTFSQNKHKELKMYAQEWLDKGILALVKIIRFSGFWKVLCFLETHY